MNNTVFILYSVNILHYINWFLHVESSSHCRDKSHLFMLCDPFNVLLDLVCWYFIKDFFTNIHQGYWLVVFFSYGCNLTCNLSWRKFYVLLRKMYILLLLDGMFYIWPFFHCNPNPMFLWLCFQGNTGLIKQVWNYSLLFFFGRVWEDLAFILL